eukprot:6193903-Pleurochrysis_carterae.AAC.2
MATDCGVFTFDDLASAHTVSFWLERIAATAGDRQRTYTTGACFSREPCEHVAAPNRYLWLGVLLCSTFAAFMLCGARPPPTSVGAALGRSCMFDAVKCLALGIARLQVRRAQRADRASHAHHHVHRLLGLKHARENEGGLAPRAAPRDLVRSCSRD